LPGSGGRRYCGHGLKEIWKKNAAKKLKLFGAGGPRGAKKNEDPERAHRMGRIYHIKGLMTFPDYDCSESNKAQKRKGRGGVNSFSDKQRSHYKEKVRRRKDAVPRLFGKQRPFRKKG